jgi:hypothetical protein
VRLSSQWLFNFVFSLTTPYDCQSWIGGFLSLGTVKRCDLCVHTLLSERDEEIEFGGDWPQ